MHIVAKIRRIVNWKNEKSLKSPLQPPMGFSKLSPVFNQARLAQLVVRLIRNEQVGGSNPLPGSTQRHQVPLVRC